MPLTRGTVKGKDVFLQNKTIVARLKSAGGSMKKIIYAFFLFMFVTAGSDITFAGDKKDEATVKVISQIPAKTSQSDSGANTKITVIQINDPKNGIVCYGLVSVSDVGRSYDGGYPGTSIFCAKVK